jgi:Tat protein translocase TatB subunit
MFDIGFSEILVIFVLALVVLGPEKLPRVAAQVGRWIGRARGMARQFREQLEEEVNLEEARKAQPPPSPRPPLPPPVVPQPAVPPEPAGPLARIAPPPVPPLAEPEQQTVYPDHYSHAHPTDPQDRPVAAPANEPAAVESRQQDWVGGVTDKPAEGAADAAYAPPHERGT